jgi:choline dehydrogenase-like flavoprotein
MDADGRQAVVDERGRHFALDGLSVDDASNLPTSIGLNPQTTIYATALRNAQQLAADLRQS